MTGTGTVAALAPHSSLGHSHTAVVNLSTGCMTTETTRCLVPRLNDTERCRRRCGRTDRLTGGYTRLIGGGIPRDTKFEILAVSTPDGGHAVNSSSKCPFEQAARLILSTSRNLHATTFFLVLVSISTPFAQLAPP